MSGSRAIVLRLSVTGAEQLVSDLKALGPAGERALAQLDAAASKTRAGLQGISQAAGSDSNGAGGGIKNFTQIMGQAGYQIQDFAVQVQGGTSALTALGQQGPQLLGVFGPAGAIAGAILTVGTLAAQILLTGENSKKAEKEAEAAFKGMAEAAKLTSEALKEVNALFQTTEQRARATARATVDQLRVSLTTQQQGLIQRNEGNTTDLTQAQRELDRLEKYVAQQEQLRARLRASGQMSPEGEADTERGALFTARARVQGLQQDISRTSERLGDLNTAYQKIEKVGFAGGEENGPPVPQALTQSFRALNEQNDKRAEIMREYEEREQGLRAAAVREGASQDELTASIRRNTAARDDALKKLNQQDGAEGRAAAKRAQRLQDRSDDRLADQQARISALDAEYAMRDAPADERRAAAARERAAREAERYVLPQERSQYVEGAVQQAEKEARNQSANQVRQQTRALDDNLEIVRAERGLIFASTEEREKQLTVIRAQQAANRFLNEEDRQAYVAKASQLAGETAALRAQQELVSSIENSVSSRLTQAWSDVTENGTNAFQAMGGVAKGVINDIAAEIIKLQVAKPAASFLSGLLGNVFGAAVGGAVGGVAGNGAPNTVPEVRNSSGQTLFGPGFHSGGMVGSGEASFHRMVPASIFAGAQRRHSGGLTNEEIPIIAQKGEGVFTKGQMAALGAKMSGADSSGAAPVSVQIDARGAGPREIDQLRAQIGPMAVAAVQNAAQRGGRTAAAIRGGRR